MVRTSYAPVYTMAYEMIILNKRGHMAQEIVIDKRTMIVTRTDTRGVIEYANQDFCDISGYSVNEVIGKAHSIVRHPDMPKVIFKLMWQRIKAGKDIFAVVKNLAKNGDYYWVTTKFSIRRHPFDNHIVGYIAHRQGADKELIEAMSKLYVDLLSIEKDAGMEASEKYLFGFLESQGKTYDEYVEGLVAKGGDFKAFFGKMMGLFK